VLVYTVVLQAAIESTGMPNEGHAGNVAGRCLTMVSRMGEAQALPNVQVNRRAKRVRLNLGLGLGGEPIERCFVDRVDEVPQRTEKEL